MYTDRVKCKKCGVAVREDALECPGCGVIFAKLKEKGERDKREAALDLDLEQAPKAPGIDLWRGRKIAAGIVLLWIVAFVLYYRHAIAAAKRRAELSDSLARPTVMMRDPQTGEMREIPVFVSPSKAR
mgnify:CR=1 FL=1